MWSDLRLLLLMLPLLMYDVGWCCSSARSCNVRVRVVAAPFFAVVAIGLPLMFQTYCFVAVVLLFQTYCVVAV